MNKYIIDLNRCSGCSLCAEHCPEQAILIEEKQARILADRCNACGTCLTICKRSAIRFINLPLSPAPVIIDRSMIRATRCRAHRQRRHAGHDRHLNRTHPYQREAGL